MTITLNDDIIRDIEQIISNTNKVMHEINTTFELSDNVLFDLEVEIYDLIEQRSSLALEIISLYKENKAKQEK